MRKMTENIEQPSWFDRFRKNYDKTHYHYNFVEYWQDGWFYYSKTGLSVKRVSKKTYDEVKNIFADYLKEHCGKDVTKCHK